MYNFLKIKTIFSYRFNSISLNLMHFLSKMVALLEVCYAKLTVCMCNYASFDVHLHINNLTNILNIHS